MGKLISLSTMREIVVPIVQVGQMVRYNGDMANPSGFGAVVALTGNEHGRYTVALADGREISHTNLDSPHRWQILDETAEGDTLNILRAGVSAKRASDAAAKSSAAEEFERIKAQLKRDNPHLIQDETGSYVQAAKNIRIELKRTFPGIKFSVRSSSYSGGDSIDIGWTDGPTTDQVDKIAGKYSGGHFDGMTDCYEYSRSPWIEVFGNSKYVHTRRDYSDAMLASVLRRVSERFGFTAPSIEDYRMGRTYNTHTDNGIDVGREINAALSRHTYCIAKVQS